MERRRPPIDRSPLERTGFHTAADGTEIWYGTAGQGTPLVLCDGFACDGFIWPYLIDHFHDRFQIIRWHYRGHGQSAAPADEDRVSVEDICHDLHGVLGELGVDRAIFVGHSMGVQVILEYYALFPDQVQALVPICGTYKRPLDTFHNHDKLAQALPYLDRLVTMAPERAQAFWTSVNTSRLSALASRLEVNARLLRSVDFLPYLEHVARMDVRIFVRMLKRLAEHSAEEVLAAVRVPTLIVAGERDTFTPMYRSEEMHAQIADSELLIVPGGTHVGPLELPDLVNAAVEKFMLQRELLR